MTHEIAGAIGDKTLKVKWNTSAYPSQCGASIISAITGEAFTKTKDQWGAVKIATASIDEYFKMLDSKKESLLQLCNNTGFTLLSDRISDAKKLSNNGIYKEVSYPNFRVSDFVRYLISRRIGTVIRGPVCMNSMHEGATAVTIWIWVMRQDLIIDADAYSFNADKFMEDTQANIHAVEKKYPGLAAQAKAYIKDELDWADETEKSLAQATTTGV